MFRKLVLSMTLVMAATAAFAAEDVKEGKEEAAKANAAARVESSKLSAVELQQVTVRTESELGQSSNTRSKAMASVLADPATKLNGDAEAAKKAQTVGNDIIENRLLGMDIDSATAKALKDNGINASEKDMESCL